jgi:subtilisin family serine protease
MLHRPTLRYRLANHVQGLPFDPPRWGEQPRLRSKESMRQGRGTTVAVLDSGVSQHPWLADSFAEKRLPEDALEQWDLSGPGLPRHVGHGTFVAGVVLQYAPAARLHPRRVIDIHGDADDMRLSAVIDGLVDVDPDVVNLSLGPTLADEPGEVDEGTERTVAALRRLQDTCGTVVVVAAGNTDEPFPADHIAPEDPLTVVVGALDLSGQPAWFSRIEPVQIWAPGVDILSSFVHFDGPMALDHPPKHHEDGHGGHADAGHPDASHGHASSGHEHAEHERAEHGEHEHEHAEHKRAEHEHGEHEHGGHPPAPVEHPLAPFAGWARWNGTSFAAPAVAGALSAEISALADIADRKERRKQALANVLDAARPLTGEVKGVALAAWPVALQGPPA